MLIGCATVRWVCQRKFSFVKFCEKKGVVRYRVREFVDEYGEWIVMLGVNPNMTATEFSFETAHASDPKPSELSISIPHSMFDCLRISLNFELWTIDEYLYSLLSTQYNSDRALYPTVDGLERMSPFSIVSPYKDHHGGMTFYTLLSLPQDIWRPSVQSPISDSQGPNTSEFRGLVCVCVPNT